MIKRITRSEKISDEQLDAILKDPSLKAAMLKKIGLSESDRDSQRSTPSGTSSNVWPPYPPVPFWPSPYPPFPMGPAAAVPTWMDGRGPEGRGLGQVQVSDQGAGEGSSHTSSADAQDED